MISWGKFTRLVRWSYWRRLCVAIARRVRGEEPLLSAGRLVVTEDWLCLIMNGSARASTPPSPVWEDLSLCLWWCTVQVPRVEDLSWRVGGSHCLVADIQIVEESFIFIYLSSLYKRRNISTDTLTWRQIKWKGSLSTISETSDPDVLEPSLHPSARRGRLGILYLHTSLGIGGFCLKQQSCLCR